MKLEYKRITFRKLYQRIEIGEYSDAIVAFNKEDWIGQTRVLPDEERKEKGYTVENVIIQWIYRIKIDLYFVVFDFGWLYPSLNPQGDNKKISEEGDLIE